MNIKKELQNGFLIATLSRPSALNALNLDTLTELKDLIQDVYNNSQILGLILTGEGEKAFVAGADIKEFSNLNKQDAIALSQRGQQLFKLIEDCPKPVIAAVNGFALGGGCELAMACHIRVASQNAKFGQPEINLGIIPGYGGTQRLAQLIGRGKALELMLTGDTITAEEAKGLGLVNHITKDRVELMDLAVKLMIRMIGKSPIAIRNVIGSVNAGYNFEGAGYTAEAQNFSNCTATEDFKEGVAAFLEKRQPNFKGQ